MGPVEFIFLVLLGVFAIIGIVRGYPKELGVTTLLLVGLFVLELLSERYGALVEQTVGIVSGDPSASGARAWLYVILLIGLAFISYQGQSIVFPGKAGRTFFDVGTGLLNGYLLVGSIWYYFDQAGWPALPVTPPFSTFYQEVVRLLPPAVFTWPYFIGLAVILLIARVWR